VGKEKDRSEYYVRSVQRALAILDCFTERTPYLGVSEISEKLGIHKSTIHALLVTLEDSGYVAKDNEKEKYFLTYKLFRLGSIVSSNIDVKTIAAPYMEELSRETGQSVALNVESNDKRLVLSVFEVNDPIKIYLSVGQELSLHSSAAGKVLLAGMEDAEIDKLIARVGLEAMTPNTITDKDVLFKEIDSVRRNGYAVCNGESYWAGSVSVPILDCHSKTIASLCIYGPIQDYDGDKKANYVETCKRYGTKISEIMGYVPK